MARRTVLVTGGAGFIGSNIAARFAGGPDTDVVVCDRLRTASSGKWRNLRNHPIADFVAPEALFDWLAAEGAGVDLVVHMAAVSSTTEEDADKIIHANFTLSRDLFRWCAERGKPLIYASSAATYGQDEAFIDDDRPEALAALRPLNAYGWSKALFDLFAAREAARGSAPPQWAGLKFFNVYGPNEGHKGPMRSVVSQIWPKVAGGETVELFKSHREGVPDGGQTRDFIYVEDVVEVVSWLAANPDVSGIYNLGSGVGRTFEDLAKATFAAAGLPARIAYKPMPEAIRDRYQYFTTARMDRLRAAGYARPASTLEDGVGDYVRRYLSQPDPYL